MNIIISHIVVYVVGVLSGIFLIALVSANGREPYEDHEQIEYLKNHYKKKRAKDRNEY